MTRPPLQALTAGSGPPALLRSRVILPADEVLVVTYNADLRFFERVGLPEARAAGARVTVIRDIAAEQVSADAVRHAGVHYTDVPVRCRSDGEFHPKLLVVTGPDRTLVAVGSGNASTSGWHHNGELWTILVADPDDWPTTFHDLAGWLTDLPPLLWIDDFGRDRLAAVAAALTAHPATTTGPRLLHNLRTPLIDQLPAPTGPVTHLTVASPFLDTRARALHRLTGHLDPQAATLALTENAQADAATLAAWAARPGAEIRPIDADGRYFHGKLVQWNDDHGRHTLTGSANVTAAALLRSTAQPHGNCELALLSDLAADVDLTPDLGEPLTDADAVQEQLTDEPPPSERDTATPRLLRVLLDRPLVRVTLVADGPSTGWALSTRDGRRWPLVADPADTGQIHQLTADADLAAGALCWVEAEGHARLGPVRATDPDAVTSRPGPRSPLEDAGLDRVLADRRLSERLFEALLALAAARPAALPADLGRAVTGTLRWRRTAERAVGSALVAQALGPARRPADAADPDADADDSAAVTTDPGDAVSEYDENDDASLLGDDEPDVDTGLLDPLQQATDPVSTLLADPITAARLARSIARRVPQAADWGPVALLGLLDLTLIVAAAGGWPDRERAADAVGDVLDLVLDAPAGDDDVQAACAAATLVALAVLASVVDDWDDPDDSAAAAYERRRLRARLTPEAIDPDRVAHYAADLANGLGRLLTVDAILDAAEHLLTTSTADRVLEGMLRQDDGLQRPVRRLLQVEAPRSPYPTAMRLLSRIAHLHPIAVLATGPAGTVHAAWSSQTLLLQRSTPTGTPISGSQHRLPVGPGAYTTSPPPTALRRWHGPIPDDLAAHLRSHELIAGERASTPLAAARPSGPPPD
ncbi:hypothetical protein [Geodermatophilus sp. SYSU D00698]